MRVLHIPNYYYPHIGGIEMTARDLVRCLSTFRNTQQKVLCMNDGVNQTVEDDIDGIDVVRCSSPIKIFSQSLSVDFGRELKQLFNNFQPDTVILHWPNPFTAFYLLRYKDRGFKLVLYWHSDIIKQRLLGKLLYSIADAIAKRSNIIIATSPNYIEGSKILKKYESKCHVVPSCINPDRLKVTEKIKKRAEKIRKENGDKTICFAFGRHVPYKGFEYLEEAVKLLSKNIKVIIGDKLSEEDLIANLYACDIFCFPSITKNEAFGLSLAEAMYMGKPAVTFTIPGSGVNYVSIDRQTGIECPNRDSERYAAAIKELASNSDYREQLGKNAHARVKELFIFDKYYESIKKIFKEVSNADECDFC